MKRGRGDEEKTAPYFVDIGILWNIGDMRGCRTKHNILTNCAILATSTDISANTNSCGKEEIASICVLPLITTHASICCW